MLKISLKTIAASLVFTSSAFANEVLVDPSWDLDRLDQTTPSLDSQYVKPPIIDPSQCKTLHVITSANDIGAIDLHLKNALHSCVNLVYKTTTPTTSGLINSLNSLNTSSNAGDVVLVRLGSSANASIDSAAANLIRAGLSIVATAGSTNNNACNYSPGRESSVLTINDSNTNDLRSNLSNYGNCVDASAPANFNGAGAVNVAAAMANCGASTGITDPNPLTSMFLSNTTYWGNTPVINSQWCN